MGELVHVLRSTEVGQPVHPQVEQLRLAGEAVGNELVRGSREHHLAAVGDRAEPGAAAQCSAEGGVLEAEAATGHVRVQRDSHMPAEGLGPPALGDRALYVESRAERVGGPGEAGHDRVRIGELGGPLASVAGHRRRHDLAKDAGRVCHRVRGGGPEPGGVLEVRVDECDRPRGTRGSCNPVFRDSRHSFPRVRRSPPARAILARCPGIRAGDGRLAAPRAHRCARLRPPPLV